MFIIGKQLTNVRAEKNDSIAISATPTPGHIKISISMAAALGLTDTSRVGMIMLDQEGAESVPAIFVSPFGHKKEGGKIILDDEGKLGYFMIGDEVSNDKLNAKGQKLAYVNSEACTGNLSFSSRNVWDALKGSKEGTRTWEVPGLEEGEEAVNWILHLLQVPVLPKF